MHKKKACLWAFEGVQRLVFPLQPRTAVIPDVLEPLTLAVEECGAVTTLDLNVAIVTIVKVRVALFLP